MGSREGVVPASGSCPSSLKDRTCQLRHPWAKDSGFRRAAPMLALVMDKDVHAHLQAPELIINF